MVTIPPFRKIPGNPLNWPVIAEFAKRAFDWLIKFIGIIGQSRPVTKNSTAEDISELPDLLQSTENLWRSKPQRLKRHSARISKAMRRIWFSLRRQITRSFKNTASASNASSGERMPSPIA